MTGATDIVVGIGLTGESGYVLEKVVGLAGNPERVLAVHVLEHPTLLFGHTEAMQSLGDVETQIEDNARLRLARLCNRFGVTQYHITRGHPAAELHVIARDVDAGLIAIGTHGSHGWRRVLGDTANAVLHGTDTNVLAILTHDELPEVEAAYRRIVVAVDMSDESRQVLQTAHRVKNRYHADMCLLTVVNPINKIFASLKLARSDAIDCEVREEVDRQLRAMAADLCLPREAAHIRTGNPAIEIQKFADEQRADLVVLGTHGTKGPVSLFGTISNDMLHGATQDVLAVRVGD